MGNQKFCTCTTPFNDCKNATEAPHGDKWYCNKKRLPDHHYEMIDGWIEEMNKAGLAPDQMIEVLKLAAEKLNRQ